MSELRVLNELGINETLLVLEPMYHCLAQCPYCYVKLNRAAKLADYGEGEAAGAGIKAGQGSRPVGLTGFPAPPDPGSFELRIERAFSPDHDPTDFEEWLLRHRSLTVFASTVEPFGNVAQARGLLDLFRHFDLPIFFQTKGLNWREVWDKILPLSGNAGFYVSFPTDDDAVLARFEPGTPLASERSALIAEAARAGFPVMAAIAPYHPDWCGDLPAHVGRLLDLGAESVFLDVLHLSADQKTALKRSRQKGAQATIEAEATASSPELIRQAGLVRQLCLDRGAGFDTALLSGPRFGLDPLKARRPIAYRNQTPWPYVDEAYLGAANRQYGPDATSGPPILIRWADALGAMEGAPGADVRLFDQAFSWSSLRRWLKQLKRLPPQWQRILDPAAPIREALRALWNQPKAGPGWRHPFTRLAMRPDGLPHLDEGGNVVMVFDPMWPNKAQKRVVADLAECVPLKLGE